MPRRVIEQRKTKNDLGKALIGERNGDKNLRIAVIDQRKTKKNVGKREIGQKKSQIDHTRREIRLVRRHEALENLTTTAGGA